MNVLFVLAIVLLSIPFQETRMKENVQSDLEVVRQGKILFGHQSVGVHVLQGVQMVAADAGAKGPKVVAIEEARDTPEGFLADVFIGKNGDPAAKCADFLRTSLDFPPGGLDAAAMKFCYADIGPKTNVREVFDLYRRTVDSLRAARPDLVIVHCTVPLTARTALWRRLAKRLLGREDAWDVGNRLRNEYNKLLRERYANEPIFDIAATESTFPDGSRSSFEQDGEEVYTLIAEYADDGKHPNEQGSKIVGAEFVRVLAEALGRKGRTTSTTSQVAGEER